VDPWEVAGVITGLLVGLVSAFLAWRAVQIGRQANAAAVKAAEEAERANLEASRARAAVASERKRLFQLEILRDLLRSFDVRIRRSGAYTMAGKLPDWEAYLSVSEILGREEARLALLPETDLPTWRYLINVLLDPAKGQDAWEESVTAVAQSDPGFSERVNVQDSLSDQAFEYVKVVLRREVLAAVTSRIAARDD
jgi:hypothetical protein